MTTSRPRALARRRLVHATIVLFASLAAFTSSARGQEELAPRAVQLGRADFADPFVLREGATYYAFATGVDRGHLQVARSNDLHAWSVIGEALPRLPDWAASAAGLTWAPSVLRRGGRYILYYSTRDAASGFQCISRATAEAPAGPYVDDSAQAFVCQTSSAAPMCGSIDPSPFVESDGTAYLLWKSDENAALCHAPSHLWSQRLSEDGLGLVGSPRALVVADRPWEAQLIEGPSMWLHDGTYYLFYSANWHESARYAIGYATCATPIGPCVKKTIEAPLVQSDSRALGPGGEELFTDAGGSTWMAYHAWSAPHATYAEGGARSLRLAPVEFEHGGPVVGSALP